MTPDDHQRVIDELQTLIEETQQTLTRFEATGMDEELAADYEKLLEILDNAIKQQREQTKALLLV
ncbi:MAG: hypothetical protein Q8S08_04255 [Halomonas sp.]|nr:hypothetical protein [Halomonas sp.]MDP3534589.1 hypothetical protein [Halomonas sp.]